MKFCSLNDKKTPQLDFEVKLDVGLLKNINRTDDIFYTAEYDVSALLPDDTNFYGTSAFLVMELTKEDIYVNGDLYVDPMNEYFHTWSDGGVISCSCVLSEEEKRKILLAILALEVK